MASYSYDTYEDFKKSTKTNSFKPRSKVGYFKLNEGEEAIVRFNYSSPKEFNIVTVHNVKVGDKYRKVSCLRKDGREPLDNCPLCARGDKVSTRFFVKLIHYTKDETGKVIATPEVANLPKKYADTLANLIQEYGDLKESLFKVKKTGSGLETQYSFFYANPAIYKEELGYTKDFSDFNDLDLAHHDYVEKSKEDIEEYFKTGEFPYRKVEESKPAVDSVSTATLENHHIETQEAPKVSTVPSEDGGMNFTQRNTSSEFNPTSRPRRTYDFDK